MNSPEAMISVMRGLSKGAVIFVVARYKDQVARAKTYGLIKGDVDVDACLEPKYCSKRSRN